MNIGSVWRKWDLHVHTPESFYHEFGFLNEEEREKYKNDIWEKYIDELEKTSDVCVIGITDYFTIEGYKRVLDYRKKGRLQNFELILPNIEFRLDKFVADRRLNYHAIFSDEIDADKIGKEFLEELHVRTPGAEPRKLIRDNIEEIGRTLKRHQEEFKGKSDYVVGCENISVSLDEIREVLKSKESIFGGKYILVLAEEGWDSISWAGQDHLTRKEIAVRSHAIFSSNPNTRDWALGKRQPGAEDFVDEFGSLKACVHGSDAHCFERLCKPDEDRFCWIKADPSFEGLKQIVCEPEERVKIQPGLPEYRKSIYTLSSIRISDSLISSEVSIAEQEVRLNRNLVAVTGGKGSGKTALLDLIANCFEDRCKRAGVDRNSFVQRIEEQKPDLKVEIAFIGEDIEEFSKKLVDEEFFRDSAITYLPQGKIEEYSGDRQKLDRKVQEIIFSNKEVVEKGYKQEFDRLEVETAQLAEGIDETNWEIYELEKETQKEVIGEIERRKAIKEGELKNKQDELGELTETMDKDITERVARLKEQESTLREKHSKFDGIRTELEEFKSELEGYLDTSNKTICDLNRELSELMVDLAIPELDFKPQLEATRKALKVIPQEIKKVTKRIKDIEEKLSQLSGIEKAHAQLLKQVEGIRIEIESLKEQLEELNEKKGRIPSLESEREKKYKALASKYCEWKKHYEEVIDTFSRGKSEILGGIDFRSSIYVDKDRFVELGSDVFDLRSINTDEIQRYAEELEATFTIDSHVKLASELGHFVKKLLAKRGLLKSTRTTYDFYKWAFGDYFSLSTQILFTGRLMDKLSMGEKGTVLLELFLAEGDYPLIVDQPEESLDNKFIYEELVGAFREAKKKRPIIIATNNANLVVNTDAEQIIVAEFKDNIISYKLGSLENLEMRKDIIPILEGGKEAFRKREEKYGM